MNSNGIVFLWNRCFAESALEYGIYLIYLMEIIVKQDYWVTDILR